MSKLILVPSPIGNMEDMSFRAVKTLKEANLILSEDTRVSSKLLFHYEISGIPLWSYHQHNEHQLTQKVVDEITNGKTVAMLTDAGTPGISDPGFYLVRACIAQGIDVETLPGATAFIPALVNSGLPCDRFVFEGFLPHKKGRQSRLKELAEHKYTFVLYESPHRLLKTLAQLAEFLGENRLAAVSRELTKLHEENVRGSLIELHNYFENNTLKGEFVIVCSGNA